MSNEGFLVFVWGVFKFQVCSIFFTGISGGQRNAKWDFHFPCIQSIDSTYLHVLRYSSFQFIPLNKLKENEATIVKNLHF